MIQRDAGRALVTERSDSLQQALDIYQTDLQEILRNSNKKILQSPSSYLTYLKLLQVENVGKNEGKEGGGSQACRVGVCSETSNGHSDSAQGETSPCQNQMRSGIWVWQQSREIKIWPPWVPVHVGACREVTQIHKIVQHGKKIK